MASVVSLRTLERKFPKVSYCSTERDAAFIVATPSGEVVFQRCGVTGFPYIDLTEHGDDMAVQLVQADETKVTTASGMRGSLAVRWSRLSKLAAHKLRLDSRATPP